MPFVKVYVHFVWSTKNRVPTLNSMDLRQTVWQHIRENAKKKDLFIDFVNGHAEHYHCLVSLGVDQTISKVMQLIKEESAFWFNKQGLTKQKLEWQDEYFAVSVSESQIDMVRNYIKNQEEHHKHKTFQQEYDEFIIKYGFKKFAD
jgi:putative transposase